MLCAAPASFWSPADAACSIKPHRELTPRNICPPQVLVQVLVFAFLVVMGCTAIMVPVLLYGFDLRHAGWRWQHAALFTSMVAGTDAVAVSAIIKGGMSRPIIDPHPEHNLTQLLTPHDPN